MRMAKRTRIGSCNVVTCEKAITEVMIIVFAIFWTDVV
jgi:hypothetical protein